MATFRCVDNEKQFVISGVENCERLLVLCESSLRNRVSDGKVSEWITFEGGMCTGGRERMFFPPTDTFVWRKVE